MVYSRCLNLWCCKAGASVVLMLLCANVSAQSAWRFIAIGDMPYGADNAIHQTYAGLVDEINRQQPELVFHLGDLKSGKERCTDKRLGDQLEVMNSIQAPVIFTPGDNDWTDCHRKKAGRYNPLERLQFLRKTFFANPASSLGQQPITVAHQGALGYPENVRFEHKGVTILSCHIVGSDNNRPRDGAGDKAEWQARTAAAVRWLQEGFAAARNSDAVVLAIHADLFKQDYRKKKEQWRDKSGVGEFGRALIDAAEKYNKPVLLLYGDSHRFKLTRPFIKKAQNIVALQVFGESEMHGVEVVVDNKAPEVFSFKMLFNPLQPQ